MTAHTPPLSSRLAAVLLGLLGVVACVVFLAYLSVRHVLWPRLDEWRPRIVAALERQSGLPVSIGRLHPGWEGLHPTLDVERLRIDGSDGEPRLEVATAQVRVSWRSLLTGRPRLAVLRLASPVVVLERLAPDRIAVAGLALAQGDGPADGRGLDWLLSQGDLSASGATLRFIDRTGALPPQQAEGLAFRLRNVGRRHQASLSVEQAGGLAGAVAAVTDFDRPPLTRPSDWRQWRGEAHVSLDRVDLARTAALAAALGVVLPGPAAGAAGLLDALAWLRFDDGGALDGTVKLRADQAAWPLEAGRLQLERLAAEVRVERRLDGGLLLRAGGLSLTDAGGFTLAADGDAELGLAADASLRTAWLRLGPIDAAEALQALRRLPLPPAVQQRLGPVEVSGSVRDLTLRWAGPDGAPRAPRPADRSADAERQRPASPRLEVTAGFEQLGLRLRPERGQPEAPSFANLSGTVRVDGDRGALTVAARGASLSFPGVFAAAVLPFDRLDGELAWHADPAGGDDWLQFEVPRVAFANADLRGSASGRWHSGGKGPGVVALEGRVERVDARRVPRYLPLQLPHETREWVARAIPSGTFEDLAFEVRGDLWDFPFREAAEGRFRIESRVRDATLAFAPDWPRIEQIRGELVFEGAGFDIRAQSGLVGGVRLTDIQARLPEYREAMLTVEGRGAGAAQDMLRFVDASPLAATVATFTRDVKVGGDARLGLRLALPLADLGATRVAGTVDFPGNDVLLDTTLPPFSGVTGRLEFTERGLSLPELRGTLLGGPIRVEARPAGDGRLRIDATGTIDAPGMRQLVDNPLTRRLEGRTDYRARVEVDRRASTLRLESDLVGLASTLPEPFAKPAAAAWPLRVVATPLAPSSAGARPPGDRLEVRLRDRLALAVERERDRSTDTLRVRRAGLAVGGDEPVLRDTGLSVLLRTRSLDFDAWRALLGDGDGDLGLGLDRPGPEARAGSGVRLSLVPDLVSVVADDLRVGGQDLHEVVLGASRLGGRWRANVASREVQGHFDWVDARPGEPTGTLIARFNRLALPRSRETEVERALSAPPSRLPALDVSVDELVLGSVTVGSLTLAATNGGTAASPVWALDRLVLANPAARLEAKGAWALARSGAARDTALDFRLEVRDAGALLERFGLAGTVRGGSGTLGGAVHWRGSPLAIDYPSLDGTLRIDVGKGAFLKVDPGAAKLIGVLNLQSLPKRLSGDFRDLFGEGFAFDSLEGDVRITAGIARTDELRLRGVQAQVRIRGDADLQAETQRLQVEVVPEFNAGLASLAVGAMVNPVIGLGSFAAQYVLRKPLQEVLAYEVDVTGSWSDPEVSERYRRVVPVQQPPTPVQ